MGSISLNGIRKSFGEIEVLKDINLDIKDGEFLILIGPSGCGKSTLMNLIAGLEDLTDGEIVIDGNNVSQESPKDRDIAMVFQSYALYPTMNVARNICFGLEMSKMPKEEQEVILKKVSSLLQIDHLLDRKPGQLSGGQRQRVAMGRALARSPKVFLFDEPLSNLDAKLRVQMRKELLELHHKLDITTIFVTHDQEEANAMSTNLAIFNEGIVQQMGRPVDLYNNPTNAFVANFLGTTNVIEGEFKNSVFTSKNGMVIKGIGADAKGTSVLLRPQNLYLEIRFV